MNNTEITFYELIDMHEHVEDNAVKSAINTVINNLIANNDLHDNCINDWRALS